MGFLRYIIWLIFFFIYDSSIILGVPSSSFITDSSSLQIKSDTIRVYFGFDSSRISLGETNSFLSGITGFHRTDTIVQIKGHTDSRGSNDYNLRLSQSRSTFVRSLLIDYGIQETNIEISPLGEQFPVSPNTDENSRRLNRRVEVIFFMNSQKEVPILLSVEKEEISDIIEENTQKILYGFVSDAVTGVSVKTSFEFRRGDEKEGRFLESDSSGYFEHEFNGDLDLRYSFALKGYFFKNLRVLSDTLILIQPGDSFRLDVKLEPLFLNAEVVLRNIYFKGNQATILPDSESALQNLLKFMQINESVHIEIKGHINHPTTYRFPVSRDSEQLSVDRARVIHEYLKENGVPSNRLEFKGYSNKEMVYPHASRESQMKYNRRVEIKITKL